MKENFNTSIVRIDFEAWEEICVRHTKSNHKTQKPTSPTVKIPTSKHLLSGFIFISCNFVN